MNSRLEYIRRNLKYLSPPNWKKGAAAAYRRIFRTGVFVSQDELGMCSLCPVLKLEKILELVRPKSVLDAGCGVGKTTVYLAQRGLDVLGLEASKVAIRASERPDLIRRHDLKVPLDLKKKFDLVWCFEVAEHIHPAFTNTFVDTLTRHAGVVALSAAPPGQGGEGHFNEQPQNYWVKKFSERGFGLQGEWTTTIQRIDEFYSKNMMVFVRRPDTVGGSR